MKSPDIDAIKRLNALDVGRSLGIIHQQVKQLSPSRWAFRGSKDATYIQFFRDGSYQDHKRDIGGSCIDLVIQSMSTNHDHDQRHFNDAAKRIAEQFNLWKTTEEIRTKSSNIARQQNGYKDKYAYLKSALDAVLTPPNSNVNGWSESLDQIDQFLAAFDLDRSAVTWGAIAAKTESLGFAPAVPWQGRPFHQKESSKNPGEFHPFGGWTKELAVEHSSSPSALRIFCIDIDGDGERLARLDLLTRLVYQLKKRGIPPRAIVVSTWDTRGEIDRVKAHIYFFAKVKAKNPDEFKTWHEHIESNICNIFEDWIDVHEEEKQALKRDHATHNISRIMRVPGIAKYKRSHAAILYDINQSATVDFQEIVETTPVVVEYANRRYHFGERCIAVTIKDVDGMKEEKAFVFARNVWPLRNYRRTDTGESGVIYRYHTRSGDVEYGSIKAAAFTNKNKGQRASADASEQGVWIRPESENTFASALGFWAHTGHGASVNLVSQPGWQTTRRGRVYVNGDRVYGPGSWEVDHRSRAIKQRSSRAGTLQEWRFGKKGEGGFKGADDLITTFGIGLLLGQSLAGPLIEMLDLIPFTIHVCGDTTHGKTTAARFAGSIWGHPRYSFQSWDATIPGIENAAEAADGSCLILDEIKRFRGTPDMMASLVYSMNSTQGRLKSTPSGQNAEQKSWRITTISTGEYSLVQFLGDDFQGGHGVRFLDLTTRPGDLTTDKQHAKDLDLLATSQFGVVGDHWVRYLATNSSAQANVWKSYREWLDIVGQWSDNNETLRICDNLAVIATALSIAKDAKIISWTSDLIEQIIRWAFDLIAPDRADGATPSERAISMLHRWVLTHPYRFPPSDDLRGARQVIGFKQREQVEFEKNNGDEYAKEYGPTYIYTCEKMLKGANDFTRKAGIQPRRWLQWCVENKHAERREHQVLKGNQRERWYAFPMWESEPENRIEKGS